ncbi:MAG TPA: aliphatic sulfonate ABC transporter substrate-binding protein [Methylibium sp.]|uniref:aliphatic sulfonate ABC transporter substrate-binding protein n=1 Tax=Methylibium sp. TaxID=2067992 RepID=UPI002DBB76D7|nr:aliphatic sulfonate ABC transporter substrate-binding protein [Methylibium sp.]HEU4459550.1 aliphatic sulfonate ABC transporter substrate-binding protein [Methylibium sp.]
MTIDRRSFTLGGAALALAASGGASAQGKAPVQLRIGFQKSAVNLVLLKQKGVLEQRFAGTKLQWIEFPAGPQLLEALAVGSLDIGLTGDSPPVFAQAAGKDLRYVGAEPPKPRSSAILVKHDAPLRTLADLKGKRVALQRGSSAHYLVVAALRKAGLAWSDITPMYLPPSDARAAFERDSVDAWGIWDPFYAATEIDVKTRVLHDGVGLSSNNSFYLASSAFTRQHPATLLALFDELSASDRWLHANKKEAAQILAGFTGLSLATIHRFIERRPKAATGPVPPALVLEQQRVADAFFELGLIPKAVKVAEIVWQPASDPSKLAKAITS